MSDSGGYQRNAADCLLAARKAREPHYRKLYLFMAQSWLSIARQDDATEELLASWNVAWPIKAEMLS
jgi:hypothetical protein